MVILKRLKIFRHPVLKPDTELTFSPRVNLLIGLNGTGKTTLLQLIDMALRRDFSSLETQPFKLEYELETDAYGLAIQVENLIVPSGESTSVAGTSPASSWFSNWRYVLTWKDESAPYPHITVQVGTHVDIMLRETNGSRAAGKPSDGKAARAGAPESLVTLLGEHADTSEWRYAQRPLGLGDGHFLVRVIHSVFSARYGSWIPILDEPTNLRLSLRFDEALDWWAQFLAQGQVAYSHVPHTPVPAFTFPVPPGDSIEVSMLFKGDHWIARAARHPWNMFFTTNTASFSPGQRRVTQGGSEVLDEIVRLLDLSSVELELVLTGTPFPMSPDDPDSPLIYTYSSPQFFITRKDGATFGFDGLSFGQKRLFAFLCYLNIWRSGPVLCDELANGFHHRMIEYCRDRIGTRQAFLATQNALLLDYYGFEDESDAARSFILGEVKRQGTREWMALRQFSPAEAHEFFKDLEVGIQHVSEILRTRGLW